ncbi:hypothetical protein GLOTRDRAFT_122273 [Gloeophyllum trabeum ATCC 11539]|uniref:Mis12-domain-containing protein n=1 Tax=Gloeophyllum trabeum (strain ATCC 11539 / FP-39264 / Madison 617) TaxID=670483 RepID=S7Q1D7_GLOTA|nr:uncharacterized protein GLOTRDRAFT_122273 [Gloeophyllum trabeum ATCC 11539]EPQ53771.1 hypothetical protein GLOTRDRAFT_122273 [Gloeophyllum trabeum ATCC 11539]
MNGPQATVPSVLLPEILGFIPQLLLDDIVNIANNAVGHTVDAVEQFFQKESEKREQELAQAGKQQQEDQDDDGWDTEVEQGLVAYQTLLDSHVDIAFDFFEAWSLRNIFAIPAELPLVVPHQEGLNLEQPPEREAELMAEVEELRRKIDNMRRLERLYTRAVRKSAAQLERSQRRLQRLTFLQSPSLSSLSSLPSTFMRMYDSVSQLPPIDHASETAVALTQLRLSDPGKRQWETNRTGYFNWAVEQLMARAREQGATAVDKAEEEAGRVGSVEDVRALLEELGETREDRKDDMEED